MKLLRFKRDDIRQWLKRISVEKDVYAPVTQNDSNVSTGWQKIDCSDLPDIKPGVPEKPVKNFLFPQPETLFRFSTVPGEPDAFIPEEPAQAERDRVIFGVRPCDARSITLNAMPYENDPYYQANMERHIIIGLTCSEPCSTCFCSDTGGSPLGTEGCDLSITEIDGEYLVHYISDRGEKLLELASDISGEVGEEASGKLADLNDKLSAGHAAVKEPDRILRDKDLMELYNASFWQELADRCINCGTCTFLCPTCYCFDIQDEVLHGRGRRIRCYDSCMFPLFTQHASGHNPRGQKVQRVRNRFMHKLKYFPDRFGPLSCVGCGRCVRDCPVNIDIREVMSQLLEI